VAYYRKEMGRPQVHSQDSILDAARKVVLGRGVRAATVMAIAQASAAPKGSIYYRFASIDDLLSEMWMRAVRRSQATFIDACSAVDPLDAAVAGALSLYDFAQREPEDAQLLAAVRREDLVAMVESDELRRQLAELNVPLRRELRRLTNRLFGKVTTTTLEQTRFAVVDLPMGALRRHLIAGSPVPPTLRPQLEAAVHAALAAAGVPRS
jgi:AcrR family transcriptional regulator